MRDNKGLEPFVNKMLIFEVNINRRAMADEKGETNERLVQAITDLSAKIERLDNKIESLQMATDANKKAIQNLDARMQIEFKKVNSNLNGLEDKITLIEATANEIRDTVNELTRWTLMDKAEDKQNARYAIR